MWAWDEYSPGTEALDGASLSVPGESMRCLLPPLVTRFGSPDASLSAPPGHHRLRADAVLALLPNPNPAGRGSSATHSIYLLASAGERLNATGLASLDPSLTAVRILNSPAMVVDWTVKTGHETQAKTQGLRTALCIAAVRVLRNTVLEVLTC
jgi:hypothetical protein